MKLRVDTPHGRALIVDASEAVLVLPEERALGAAMGEVRRAELYAGRTALRAALVEDLPEALAIPILSDDRGAPILPAGWVGSISHKHGRAAALVAADRGARIGVDLEAAVAPRQDIGRRILTPRERAQLADERGVTLRFAIKEAIYKAIDPFERRYVGFLEVELDVAADGGCVVTTELPLAIEAWWTERDGHWLATARAHRRA